MRYSVVVKSGTTIPAEPITLTEAKLHCRVDSDLTADDDLIEGLITAAREWAENHTRRSFVRRTLELRMDAFPSQIKLPRGPVSAVSHVYYTDAGGNQAEMSSGNYQADLHRVVPVILPVFGGVWPTVKWGALNSVLVEYVAGYAPGEGSPTDYAENIPNSIKAAIKLIVGHLYENREQSANVALGTLPFNVKHLLAGHEIRDFALEQ